MAGADTCVLVDDSGGVCVDRTKACPISTVLTEHKACELQVLLLNVTME